MVDNSKKSAREIGKLRMQATPSPCVQLWPFACTRRPTQCTWRAWVQLNEEKAKAKGGFGKPSTMKLGEMPKPPGAAGAAPFAARPMPGMHSASGALLKPTAAAPLAPVK